MSLAQEGREEYYNTTLQEVVTDSRSEPEQDSQVVLESQWCKKGECIQGQLSVECQGLE